jgi:RNA polymerase sigma-70 factor (ECF subfamily)
MGARSAVTLDRPDLTPDDPDALRAYVRRGLRRAIAGVDDADIEDFTQEALVRILRGRDRFEGRSRFATWAMAVALRVAFTALRTRRRREATVALDTELLELTAPESAADLGRDSERRDLMTTLQLAIIDTLTERQRTAVLGELTGVPSDVLAERLGVNRNALYKLHHDARKKLKAAILAAGFTEHDVAETLSER